MPEKYVYFVHSGQLNKSTNTFEMFEIDPYSSLKKAVHRLENSMKVNKAFDVVPFEPIITELNAPFDKGFDYTHVTTEGKNMRIRIYIERRTLK